MPSVTGYSAERMKAIEDASVVNGEVDPVTGHLNLIRFDESETDTGETRIWTDRTAMIIIEMFQKGGNHG
jgi:hypothetical protein